MLKPPHPAAIVFDMYGTLVDIAGVAVASREIVREPEAFTALWRSKQLEYTFLRTLLGRYRDFWLVTQDALDFALRRLGFRVSPEQRRRLMDAWLRPPPYPDVATALPRLADRFRLAVLSNGTPRMLRAGLRGSGLAPHIRTVISAHGVRCYKPTPRVYGLALRRLRVPKRRILFVSANPFDVAGAKAFGFRVCWINRAGAPFDALGLPPDRVASDFEGLAAALE